MSIGVQWVIEPQNDIPLHLALDADEEGYATLRVVRRDTGADVTHWFKIIGDVYVCPVTGREMWVQP